MFKNLNIKYMKHKRRVFARPLCLFLTKFCIVLFFVTGRSHVTPHFHIEEHAFPGFVDTQGGPLLVDVGDHLFGHLVGIFHKIPLAAVDLFQTAEQVVGQDVGAGGGPGDAEQGVDPGGDKVMADGDGLLTHPLGGGAGRRQVADVVAQAAGLDAGGGRHQDPGVVHAGAHVQHRRDTHGLADLGQAGAAELGGRFRRQADRPYRRPWPNNRWSGR